jgi:hypothetical protein
VGNEWCLLFSESTENMLWTSEDIGATIRYTQANHDHTNIVAERGRIRLSTLLRVQVTYPTVYFVFSNNSICYLAVRVSFLGDSGRAVVYLWNLSIVPGA